MEEIERFLASYPATIAALSAAGTLGAVIVALYLARRQVRPRVSVFVNVSRYLSSEAQIGSEKIDLSTAPEIITATVVNVGQVPISLPYFSSFIWSVRGGRKGMQQNPAEPDFRREPIELRPGRRVSIVLTKDLRQYQSGMARLASASRLGKWLALRLPKMTLVTEAGDRFKAEFGPALRKLTRETE